MSKTVKRHGRSIPSFFLAAWLFATACGFAAQYPTKPIRLVVGYPPAGANDLVARLVAASLGQRLKTQVVVDNRPGANGIIACEAVAKASPDGYTLLFAGKTPLVINPLTYPKLPYNTLTDFTGITAVASGPVIVAVRADQSMKNMHELIAAAKERPVNIAFATIGTGGFSRLYLELLKSTAKIDVRYVPYKGAAQAITDILGGQIEGMTLDLAPLLSFVKSGKLRALGISSEKRNPDLPEVRTMAEQGLPALSGGNWYAVLAPPRLPGFLTSTLHTALAEGMNAPDSKEKLAAMGMEPMVSANPQALAQMVKSDMAKLGPVVKAANVKAE